jgi:hypothetical protein
MKMLFAALHVQRVRYAAAFGVLSGLSVAIVGKRAGQFRPSVYRACPHVPKMSLHFSLSSRTQQAPARSVSAALPLPPLAEKSSFCSQAFRCLAGHWSGGVSTMERRRLSLIHAFDAAD